MGLIWDHPQDRLPRPNRRKADEESPPPTKRRTAGTSAVADPVVLTTFVTLQKIWRRQGTLRRTYGGMPSSREERGAWKQLTEYLTKQDNWA